MDSNFRTGKWREPKLSDRQLDFKTYHDLVMAVARSLGIDIGRDPSIPVLRFMELDDNLPPYDPEADEVEGKKPYIDKTATVLYYNEDTQTWERDEAQQKVNVCNPYPGTEYWAPERLPFLYLAQAAKFIPLVKPNPVFYGMVAGGYGYGGHDVVIHDLMPHYLPMTSCRQVGGFIELDNINNSFSVSGNSFLVHGSATGLLYPTAEGVATLSVYFSQPAQCTAVQIYDSPASVDHPGLPFTIGTTFVTTSEINQNWLIGGGQPTALLWCPSAEEDRPTVRIESWYYSIVRLSSPRV